MKKRISVLTAVVFILTCGMYYAEIDKAYGVEPEPPVPPGIEKKEGDIPGKGKHLGWTKGQHKGWDKEKPEKPEPPGEPED